MFYPILQVFQLSFQNYDLTRPMDDGFAGWSNFKQILFHDDLFPSSLWITIKWVVIEVVLQLVFGLGVALLLNQAFRFRGVIRSLVLIPWAVSGVLTTMLWSLMYNQHIGVINDLLKRLGIIHENIAWLSNTHTVFGSVVLAELWRGFRSSQSRCLLPCSLFRKKSTSPAKSTVAERQESYFPLPCLILRKVLFSLRC